MIKKINKNLFLFLIATLVSHQGYAPPNEQDTNEKDKNEKDTMEILKAIQSAKTPQESMSHMDEAYNINYAENKKFMPLIYSKLLSFFVPVFKKLVNDLGLLKIEHAESEQEKKEIQDKSEKIQKQIKEVFVNILNCVDSLKYRTQDVTLIKELKSIYFQNFFSKIAINYDDDYSNKKIPPAIFSLSYPLSWTNLILSFLLIDSDFKNIWDDDKESLSDFILPMHMENFKNFIKNKYDDFFSSFPFNSENEKNFLKNISFLKRIGDSNFVKKIDEKYKRWVKSENNEFHKDRNEFELQKLPEEEDPFESQKLPEEEDAFITQLEKEVKQDELSSESIQKIAKENDNVPYKILGNFTNRSLPDVTSALKVLTREGSSYFHANKAKVLLKNFFYRLKNLEDLKLQNYLKKIYMIFVLKEIKQIKKDKKLSEHLYQSIHILFHGFFSEEDNFSFLFESKDKRMLLSKLMVNKFGNALKWKNLFMAPTYNMLNLKLLLMSIQNIIQPFEEFKKLNSTLESIILEQIKQIKKIETRHESWKDTENTLIDILKNLDIHGVIPKNFEKIVENDISNIYTKYVMELMKDQKPEIEHSLQKISGYIINIKGEEIKLSPQFNRIMQAVFKKVYREIIQELKSSNFKESLYGGEKFLAKEFLKMGGNIFKDVSPDFAKELAKGVPDELLPENNNFNVNAQKKKSSMETRYF